MIKVTYYYSACVAITTPDVSILCDPWFTDGIYDGSWYQYPKVKDPIELIGKHDLIYISHIHPDHYDPVFLKKYLERYPDAKIIIAEGVFLDKKMRADGIPFNQQCAYASTSDIFIIKNESGSLSDIDTTLIVRYKDHQVVNMNDNPYCQKQIDRIKEFAPKIDIALLGHTGAGPYPQTYYTDKETLKQKAEEKKQLFFDRYKKMADALDAKVNIPFAGQYILGGHLTRLNEYRGVSDAVEVLHFDSKAIVLEEGASIDTETFEATAVRTKAYPNPESYYMDMIPYYLMDYLRDFGDLEPDRIPWGRLLHKAYHSAMDKLEYKGDYYKIIIKMPDDKFFYMHLNEGHRDCYMQTELLAGMHHYSLIEIDYRYLFGLITGVYHWNNAEVGSQYLTTRHPDVYNRNVQNFLNFFAV